MFRSHLVRFFKLFGYRKADIDTAIIDLSSVDLLETIRFGNSHVLKLKKFAVYTLLKKKPTEVSSITVTTTKILRAAFLIELLLKKFQGYQSDFYEKGVVNAINTAKNLTSYTAFERKNYQLLDSANRGKFLTRFGKIELDDLKIIEQYSNTKNRNEELESKIKSIRRQRAISTSRISLNSFSARDIHLQFLVIKNTLVLELDILDLNSQMTEKKLQEKLKLAYRYIGPIFTKNVVIRARIIVAGTNRKQYFESKLERITTDFCRSENLPSFDIQIINLDIEQRLLSGMTIIR